MSELNPSDPLCGVASADRYIAQGYETVIGMSSRFAAAVCAKLMRIQSDLGVKGHLAEIGAFEGRFFIALAHCLEAGEKALGMDVFTWPNTGVKDRFEANCRKHGVPADRAITWAVDSNKTTPEELKGKLGGGSVRFFHIDGEHTRAALSKDLELATAVLDPAGLIVLDDMLHPGYPTLVVAVEDYLARHPQMTVLCIIDRETIVAATKFVLCRRDWFKRYEDAMLAPFKAWTWPMGANFEPHWCLVLSRDTRLAAIE
jgi:hypothetical protein